jgi:guanylate kinase
MLVILSGVSGAGKDTIKELIMKENKNVVSIPSYTTREKRNYEVEGVQYYFVSNDEFEKLIIENKLYEYSKHHLNYYGTSKHALDEAVKNGNIIIKDVDVNGTDALKRVLPSNGIKVVSIFLNIDKEEMLKRLENRGDNLSEEIIALRMSRYEYEISNMKKYDYVIKNLDAIKTKDIILQIIEREQRECLQK